MSFQAFDQKAVLAVKGEFGLINVNLSNTEESAKPDEHMRVTTHAAVKQTFALSYLSLFSKASQLSTLVTIKLLAD